MKQKLKSKCSGSSSCCSAVKKKVSTHKGLSTKASCSTRNVKKRNCNLNVAKSPKSTIGRSFSSSAREEIKKAHNAGLMLHLVKYFISSRKNADFSESYTAFLAKAPKEESARMLIDEAVQLAFKINSTASEDALKSEAADLLYNMIVLLEGRGVCMSEVVHEITDRILHSGHDVRVFNKLRKDLHSDEDILQYIKNAKNPQKKSHSKIALANLHSVNKSSTSAKSKKSNKKTSSSKQNKRKAAAPVSTLKQNTKKIVDKIKNSISKSGKSNATKKDTKNPVRSSKATNSSVKKETKKVLTKKAKKIVSPRSSSSKRTKELTVKTTKHLIAKKSPRSSSIKQLHMKKKKGHAA